MATPDTEAATVALAKAANFLEEAAAQLTALGHLEDVKLNCTTLARGVRIQASTILHREELHRPAPKN
jgi:hypothetical protein